MTAYLLRRGGQTLLTLLVMSILVFVGVYLVGNPVDVMISATATPQERAELIMRMGLDQPGLGAILALPQRSAIGGFGKFLSL